jgi:hypothetical protein
MGDPYPRLATLDAKGVAGQAGVYAVWHLGVRPRWLRVGGGADLGLLIPSLQHHPDLRAMEIHGGVFVAWAAVQVAEIPGAVASLAAQVAPVLQGPVLAGEVAPGALPVSPFPLPPGTRNGTAEKP